MRSKRVTQSFLRALASFLRKHPEDEDGVEVVMNRIVAGDNSGLRMHTLHGPLKGFHSARISQQYRIIFALEPDVITFIDIGTHDEVY